MKPSVISLLFLLFFSHTLSAQCSGGSLAGTLTPTAAYQTQAVSNGQYYNVNVSCGSTYNFTFCSNGGSATWDTQITILDNTGAYVGYGYNDDACGLQSNVTFTSTFTGTVRVLISLYFCNGGGGNTATLAYNANIVAINPTFTLSSVSCTQASATVTGTTGGTFSFNPVPGGGVTINPTTGAISNGIAGATYTVQYTVCGNSSTQNVTLPTTNCWNLNGNAQFITVGSQQCIQLTAEVNDQTGCAWDDNILDFNSDFDLTLSYYFGNNVSGADGTTFTFQPNPGSCGTAGGQLGAGGIANSLVIEFDTYDNDFPTHAVDIAADHIAIEVDGNMLNSSHLAGPTPALPSSASIDDGVLHTVNIKWTASTQTIRVYFDGNLRLTTVYDVVTNVFGGDNTVRWGATAATGGLNNQQYFCPQTVVILPAELISFESICEGENELITWTTASEDRVDYFEVDYTTNGLVFYPVGQVDAIGSSTTQNTYSIESNNEGNFQKYYRIKTVDIDGNTETSDLISGNQCKQAPLFQDYSFENGNLSFETSVSQLNIVLFSSAGQELIRRSFENESMIELSGLNYSEGIYLIKVYDEITGKGETYRIFHTKN